MRAAGATQYDERTCKRTCYSVANNSKSIVVFGASLKINEESSVRKMIEVRHV